MRIEVRIADEKQASQVRALLRSAGHRVDHAPGVSEKVDVVVTDAVKNVEALRAADPALPILVLCLSPEGPADDVLARVAALKSGADDALSAPFHASQMVARVDALGRRAALVARAEDTLEIDGCTLDFKAMQAGRGAQPVQELSVLEVTLLRFLHRHRGRPVSRAELLEHVWGHKGSMETRTVDMTVARLRKKIERDAGDPRIVVGVRGVGYRWGGTE